VEGQVRGLARMVDGERYCSGVLTQISAVTKALQQVVLDLLDDHMRHCVLDTARSGPGGKDAKLEEVTTALHRHAGDLTGRQSADSPEAFRSP
jgi:CsoR family transcriptional regulator, copper-sensing transcriptional repressor